MDGGRADSFLRLIQNAQRGRLKIYLGYCAGVGKTYMMLLEAKRLMENGIDIVAGLVETHGRIETEALLEGLEIIPRKRLTYRGIEITEMDLDAIIDRKPAVVLVDELAHTNVPGSRNAKRYQDVEEILATGIHVISTLNIQHLESLFETVEQATGVKVKERLPDRVVMQADQLVNVDVATDDLLQRLKEGKVYLAGKAESALSNFFRQENLEQLRELTLREVAAQIDTSRRSPMEAELTSSPDQVMVCLSSRGENSEALLRYASRIAGRLNRNWYAVYVQTLAERTAMIDAGDQRRLSNTFALARQLGATVFIYKGDDIVSTILQFAREYRVGHIVIGNSGKGVPFYRRLKGERNLVERLINESRGITIVILDTRGSIVSPKSRRTVDSLSDIRSGLLRKQQNKDNLVAPVRNARVRLWTNVIEKEDAIRQLLETICGANPAIASDYAWRALLEREKQGATFIGEDIAIPHARLDGLDKSVLSIGVSKLGIYEQGSNNTANIMFLMLSPASQPDSHIRLLGAISKMAGDSQWRTAMLKAGSESEIIRILQQWNGGHKRT
jgi:two-component system sensor histidine kinase KdpD